MTGYKQGCNTDGELIRDFYVEHDPVELACDPDEGMTRQEFRDECDINVLMATYERNGQLNHFNLGTPQYLDVSDVPDLPKAIAIMQSAETAFMTLPASVRREFDNSAVKFVDYAADPANLEQMRKWGLAPTPPAPPPAPVAGAFSSSGAPPSTPGASAAPAASAAPPVA